MNKKFLKPKTMAIISIMSALAAVLMLFDFPLTFIAPSIYKMDLSDLPALIGTFAYGPIAGTIIEILKILIKIIIKPTSTAFIGELSNLLCGLALCIPAGIIYMKKHTFKGAVEAIIIGAISYVLLGSAMNYLFIIPAFAKMFNTPLEAIIDMGTQIIPFVKDKLTFCLICVAPFNLIKIVVVSILTLLLYKRISNLINRG